MRKRAKGCVEEGITPLLQEGIGIEKQERGALKVLIINISKQYMRRRSWRWGLLLVL
jgi:hypothetical protein